MLPQLTDTDLQAAGVCPSERAFYRACRDSLPDRMLVLHGIRMLSKRSPPEEHETDFVVIDPNHGFLAVEVKGGAVSYDQSRGWLLGSDQRPHDPFRQAADRQHDLMRWLKSHSLWDSSLNEIPSGHAVVFTDIGQDAIESMVDDSKAVSREMVGCLVDLRDLESWVEQCFGFWRAPNNVSLGASGVALIEGLLRKEVHVRPVLAARLLEENLVRLQLTIEQKFALDWLAHVDRLIIPGGAGTGKTLLAAHRARTLANEGRRVLLLCVNRLLALHLQAHFSDTPNVHANTIAQYYQEWVGSVSAASNVNIIAEVEADYPGEDHSSVIMPNAYIQAVVRSRPRYDAVVIDEGQDFCEGDWGAIEYLVRVTKAKVCVFYDPNQKLYRGRGVPRLLGAEISPQLPRNCRNTNPIHVATYRHYVGSSVRLSGIQGEPIVSLEYESPREQARAIGKAVREYLKENVLPQDIVVLMFQRGDNWRQWEAELTRQGLPRGLRWSVDGSRSKDAVFIDSVARFKGLEADVVILWLSADLDPDIHREFLYVGMSRANARLTLVGSAAVCRAALSELE